MSRHSEAWAEVEASLGEAKSIAWDGCHKIYILLDDEQTTTMHGFGYGEDGSYLHRLGEVDFLATLHEWWDDSCGLRFIESVRTDDEDRNSGFTTLIAQFELNDEEGD